MGTSACCAHVGFLLGRVTEDTDKAKGLNVPVFLVLLARAAFRNHRPLAQGKVWSTKMYLSGGEPGWGIKVNTPLIQ